MNNLINYLMGRIGKKTCPIIQITQVIDVCFTNPWKEWYEIKFKDGTILKLMEKPE